MAYQIAFDLYESATQQFLGRVLQALRATAPIPSLTDKQTKVSVEGMVGAAAVANAAEKDGTKSEEEAKATSEVKTEKKLESLVRNWCC